MRPDEALIRGLHPAIRDAVRLMLEIAESTWGVQVRVISGRRGLMSNLIHGGAPQSAHLWGGAVDLRINGLHRDQVNPEYWRALGELWESWGGRWGGRFTRPSVNHFDVA